jgi:predicted Zn-dependent peptidase
LNLENIEITTLSGGIKVVSEYIPYVQSFSLGFWFNVGTRDENSSNNGISHFIEHMIFKGSKKRSAKKISDEIESLGGYLNAFTSKEHTCFYGRGLSKNLIKIFDVIADMVQNPLFRQNDIDKESGVVIDELHDINDNPEELIFDKFEEIIFAGNTLSYPIIGKEENIRSFTSRHLNNFHTQKYSSQNLMVVCSGNIKHSDLVKLAEKYITKNKKQNLPEREFSFHLTSINEVIEKDIQQVHCIIGRGTEGYKDEKRIPLNVLSNLLGEGSSSRLFQAIREKRGITYQINSFLNSYFDISAFGIYFSTNQKQVEKVIQIINKELKKLCDEKVKEKELKRVKEYLKGNMLLSLENTSNRMIRIANSMLYFNRVVPVDEIISKVDSVTVVQLEELSNEVLNENLLSRLLLMSNKKISKKAA